MSLPKNTRQGKSNREIGLIETAQPTLETRCAVITATGRSAIAVVAVRGSDAAQIVHRCFDAATKRRFSPNEIRFGAWRGPLEAGAAAESVVVVPLTDDHFEIHCHGGPAATTRVIEDLRSCGATVTAEDQWSQSPNLLIREAERVLARCLTAKTAAIAMDQVRGSLSNEVSAWIDLAHRGAESRDGVRQRANQILKHSRFTTRMDVPLAAVLVGPPNVGKSSLMNAMVGFDRSITYDAAGTTRDVLHADTVIDGLAIRLSDTAGIRDALESIESEGIVRALDAASKADLVIEITDPSCLQAETVFAADSDGPPRIGVLNKLDLLNENQRVGPWQVATNAVTGQGVEALLSLIAREFGRQVPPTGSAVALNERQSGLIGKIAMAEDRDRMLPLIEQLFGDGNA